MRIGLMTGEYPPMQGGVGDFTRELGRALLALGHEVVVITHTGSGAHSGDDGVAIETPVAGWGWRAPGLVAGLGVARGLDVVNVQYQAAAYGMGLPIHTATLQWRLQRRRFASVVTYHDLRVPYLFPKAGPLRRQAMLSLGRHAEGVIVTNHEDEAAWRAAGTRTAVYSVPIGSNIARCLPPNYSRDAWRARKGLAPDDLVIGYFGFFTAQKGGRALLEAVHRLAAAGRPVHLLVIGGPASASDPGTSEYVSELLQQLLAAEARQRVHLTGFLSPEHVSAGLAACDIIAQPYRDGASLRRGSLMAVLAHGCATISTDGPGVTAGLREAMVTVPPDDPAALASAIAALADDAERRALLSRRAAEMAREFTWDRIAARTAEVYAESVLRRGSRS